jgi:hypothetical protein
MAEGSKSSKTAQSERRTERLAAELRANLLKRKAQVRARSGSVELPGGHTARGPDES